MRRKKVKLLMGFVLTLARLWLGYALMLLIMTYNMGLVLAISFGEAIGLLLFSNVMALSHH